MCRERMPEVDLVLKEMVTLEQVEALASSRLDIALLRPNAATADFATRCVAREPLVAAVLAQFLEKSLDYCRPSAAR
jgi:DNA-binding transcriptional LysR family regulator